MNLLMFTCSESFLSMLLITTVCFLRAISSLSTYWFSIFQCCKSLDIHWINICWYWLQTAGLQSSHPSLMLISNFWFYGYVNVKITRSWLSIKKRFYKLNLQKFSASKNWLPIGSPIKGVDWIHSSQINIWSFLYFHYAWHIYMNIISKF